MQTELDRIANQNHLQLLKALIPHLPASNRKRFSVLIKIMEVQNVIRFYNSPRAENPGSAAEESPPDFLDVLADVRCYCEGEEQQMIDQALQMMSMVELFSVMAQEEASPESGSACDSDSDEPPFASGSACGSDSDEPPSASDECCSIN